jgi:hypothetical protein
MIFASQIAAEIMALLDNTFSFSLLFVFFSFFFKKKSEALFSYGEF